MSLSPVRNFIVRDFIIKLLTPRSISSASVFYIPARNRVSEISEIVVIEWLNDRFLPLVYF